MDNGSGNERLARIEGQVDLILRSVERAEDGRRRQYESIESINNSVSLLDGRMGKLETSFAKATPTIEEFIKIKQRVKDAGTLGRWLWVVGAALITAAFRFRAEMLAWFVRH